MQILNDNFKINGAETDSFREGGSNGIVIIGVCRPESRETPTIFLGLFLTWVFT